MTQLYHYTCEHGRDGLGDEGTLLPLAQQKPARAEGMPPALQEVSQLIWLTDLEFPLRLALGLTSAFLRCDRIQYRYRVLEGEAVPWAQAREGLDAQLAAGLESGYGVKPEHWWVATAPVTVAYAPVAAQMSWSQPICRSCFSLHNPGRIPVRLVEPDTEKCCSCGELTTQGIYIRINPSTVAYPTRKAD